MELVYEYTINKVVERGNIPFDNDTDARLHVAKIKNQYQSEDLNCEYWFDYKARDLEPDVYMLQVVTDGSVTWSKQYDCALDAVHAYDKVDDYGFARHSREAVLIEPNGKVHSKTFQTPSGTYLLQ